MTTVWRAAQRQWLPSGWPGVERCQLGDDAHGGSALFRMRAGAKISLHDHPRGEHTLILEGEAMFGEVHVAAGDALHTAPGERHDVRALTDVVFLGMAPR